MEKFKLVSLILEGVKDVEYGEIKFPAFAEKNSDEDELDNASVVGVYGYNGSGKTALIDVLQLLWYFVWFKTSDVNLKFKDFACKWCKTSKISYSFILIKGDFDAKIDYILEFKDSSNPLERSFDLLKETISYSLFDKNSNGYANKVTPLQIDYTKQSSEQIISEKNYLSLSNIYSDGDDRFQKAVYLQTMKNECSKNGMSMVFADEFADTLIKSKNEKAQEAGEVIKKLFEALQHGLYVYSVKMDAESNLGSSSLIGMSTIGYGTLKLPLDSSFEMREDMFEHYQAFVEQINVLLKAFVPSFDSKLVKLDSYIKEGDNGGQNTLRVQYVRIYGENSIPFSSESNGIKKLVNIASALINAYSDSKVILAIDELDSGVFEYLLGQILDVLGEGLRGQLLFTAHNIAALSVLDKTQLYFTTTNPKNRYIRLRNMSSENNPENFYLRALKVGGQKEPLMDQTHRSEISRALRQGYLKNYGQK